MRTPSRDVRELEYRFDRKTSILETIIHENDLSIGNAIHLGNFLRELNLTPDDCIAAMNEVTTDKEPIPRINPADLLQLGTLPKDLSGRVVIDIGGYDGYVAFECLKRGAKSATVIDSQQFRGYTLPGYPYGWVSPRGYEGVKYETGDLCDISPWINIVKECNLIICFNVLYHVPSPLKALESLRLATSNDLYLSLSVINGDESYWKFDPDPARRIFFTPTRYGLEKALDFMGFKFEKLADNGHEVVYRCH